MGPGDTGDHDRDVRAQSLHGSRVRFTPSANGDVERRALTKHRKQFSSCELAEPALQAIAIDCGALVLGNDDSDTRMIERGSGHAHVEVRGAYSLPLSYDCLQIGAPREPIPPRETEAKIRRLRTCSEV